MLTKLKAKVLTKTKAELDGSVKEEGLLLDATRDVEAKPPKVPKQLNKMELDDFFNAKVLTKLKAKVLTKIRAKVLMLVDIKLGPVLSVDSYNAREERTAEVFKRLDETELDTICFNACKERTGKASKQLDRAELNGVGYNAMLLEVLTKAGVRINGFFKIKAGTGPRTRRGDARARCSSSETTPRTLGPNLTKTARRRR